MAAPKMLDMTKLSKQQQAVIMQVAAVNQPLMGVVPPAAKKVTHTLFIQQYLN